MFADALRSVVGRVRTLDRSSRIALGVLIALYAIAMLAPLIAPYSHSEQINIVTMKNQAPSWSHPFGTDRFSRDLLTRVLYGARISLTVATIAVLMSSFVGTLWGLTAASFGGVVDTVLMRLIDAFLAIPRILLLIAVLALWSPVPLGVLIVLLGLTGWFDVSRLVRAEALTVRERDFVAAARAQGAGRLRIMLRHLAPNVLGPVVVATTVGVGQIIVLEAGLSFIGIGAREPDASWGTLFSDGTEAFTGTWWTALFPGVAIVTTVLCFNILGDALRRLLDPRHLRSS